MSVAALPTPEPEPLNINLNDLTLGDLEDIEGVVGPETMRFVLRGDVTPKAMVALVWVAKRRDNPSFTLDDARRLPLSLFSVEAGESPKGGES